MVAGCLTDRSGEPLAIELYPGNPNDPPTFLEAVEVLQGRTGDSGLAAGFEPSRQRSGSKRSTSGNLSKSRSKEATGSFVSTAVATRYASTR